MNYLVSFADSRMKKSLKRISNQANEFDFFDKIFLLNEKNLSKSFKDKFKHELILGSKGYGYWCWKPEIILNILEKLDINDCLIYVDAGCHLNKNGKKRLLEYFDILKQEDKGIVAFQANTPNKDNSSLNYDGRKLRNLKNYKWIKGDVLDYFDIRDDIDIINSQEIAAGVILIKKCDQSIMIIKKWREIIFKHFNFITDQPSNAPNLPGFIENRHDQGIWTLLCMKNKIKTISTYEFWYPKKNSVKLEPDWDSLYNFPIHAKRDKDFGLLNNSLRRIKRKKYQLLNILSKVGIIKKPCKKDFYI